MQKILFIGAGNMGCAILQCLSNKPYDIFIQDPFIEKSCESYPFLKEKSNLHLFEKIEDVATKEQNFDFIFLSVKPQIVADILPKLKENVNYENSIFISILAGKGIEFFQKNISADAKIARVMPNLAAFEGKSLTGFLPTDNISENEVKQLEDILASFGEVVQVKTEDEINKITAIAGSGPGYIFYFAEELQNAAIELGFDEATASKIVKATMFGTSSTLFNSSDEAEALRKKVTSKKGTTEAGLNELMKDGILKKMLSNTANAAYKRAGELSD